MSNTPYDKLVPGHILNDVKTIEQRFAGRVHFFVSDYGVPVPDPFIMVTAYTMKRVVFGAWDEPGFGVT